LLTGIRSAKGLLFGDGDGVNFAGFHAAIASHALIGVHGNGFSVLDLVNVRGAGVLAVTVSVAKIGVDFYYVTHVDFYLSNEVFFKNQKENAFLKKASHLKGRPENLGSDGALVKFFPL
jgi:hypothetical protein